MGRAVGCLIRRIPHKVNKRCDASMNHVNQLKQLKAVRLSYMSNSLFVTVGNSILLRYAANHILSSQFCPATRQLSRPSLDERNLKLSRNVYTIYLYSLFRAFYFEILPLLGNPFRGSRDASSQAAQSTGMCPSSLTAV
jgi:hypothetical protein